MSLHAPERVPCVRALTLADLPRPACRHASALSLVPCEHVALFHAAGRTQTGWKEIALRKVQNTADETKEAFPVAYEIVETAPEGTRVTDLLDVSGMLIRGGKGPGELSLLSMLCIHKEMHACS